MKPDVLCNATSGTHPKWAAAFAAGCGGRQVSGEYRIQPGQPIALFGSPFYWPAIREAQRLGVDWYYGDHGYFRRWRYFRTTRNAFQLTGFEPGYNPARFLSLGVTLRSWRKSGRHVLLCPPDARYGTLHGFDATQWTKDVIAEIGRNTDRPLAIRPRKYRVPLTTDLRDCWAVVTYASNVAVDAICAGIPAICLASCAAWPMAGHSVAEIESPPMPDNRIEWAAYLAANQWTYDEMRRGDLWRAIGVE